MVGCQPVVDGHKVVGGGGGGVSTLQSQQPMLQLQPVGQGEEAEQLSQRSVQSGGPEIIPVLFVTNKYKCLQ